MKATIRLFWLVAIFSFFASALYTFWSLHDPMTHFAIEWVGTPALALVGLLAALIAFYMGAAYRGQGGETPADSVDAEIDDGDAEQGFFSPWSWWPVMLGASAALLFLGVAVGTWIAFIAVAIGVVSLIGWTYEYQRGYHAH
jgi:hypothetical protein